jgi:hypothetical protein
MTPPILNEEIAGRQHGSGALRIGRELEGDLVRLGAERSGAIVRVAPLIGIEGHLIEFGLEATPSHAMLTAPSQEAPMAET